MPDIEVIILYARYFWLC